MPLRGNVPLGSNQANIDYWKRAFRMIYDEKIKPFMEQDTAPQRVGGEMLRALGYESGAPEASVEDVTLATLEGMLMGAPGGGSGPANIIRYRGAKPRAAAHLAKEAPSRKVFVDLFGGSGAATEAFMKTGKFKRGIYAEKKPELRQMLQQLKDAPEEVIAGFKDFARGLSGHSRGLSGQNFESTDVDYVRKVYEGLISGQYKGNQKAAAEIFVGTYSRMYMPGEIPRFSTGTFSTPKGKAQRLKAFGRTLQDVDIVSDWRRATKVNPKEAFFFIDPPYYNAYTYPGGGFTELQHKELADFVKRVMPKSAGVVYNSPKGAEMFYPETKFAPSSKYLKEVSHKWGFK